MRVQNGEQWETTEAREGLALSSIVTMVMGRLENRRELPHYDSISFHHAMEGADIPNLLPIYLSWTIVLDHKPQDIVPAQQHLDQTGQTPKRLNHSAITQINKAKQQKKRSENFLRVEAGNYICYICHP